MPQLSFHPGFNGLVLVAVASVSALLVVVAYRRAFAAVRPGQRKLLYALRMTAIVVVLLLLFRPVLSFRRQINEPRSLVFLLDNSASMSIADGSDGLSRLQRAQDQLMKWRSQLQHEYQLHWLAFAESPATLRNAGLLAALQPTGDSTSLSRALLAGGNAIRKQSLEALVLVSDGIHNSAGDPLVAARRIGVPVHTVGAANSLRDGTSYRDVRLTELSTPEQLALDNRTRFQAYVDAIGFPGRVIQVVLREDDRQVAEQDLVLDDVEGPQEVTLQFVPETKGIHTYTVEVPALSEEKIPENNRRSISLLVVDSRIRVLYVEGTLRAEYGAVVGRFLSKDPNVEYCALVQTRPNVFTQRSNIDSLHLNAIPSTAEQIDSFDVFLLGDLDSTYLQPQQMDLIRRRVQQGAGLLMMGGYHSLGPGGYEGTPLAELLPVFVGGREIGQIDEPFDLQLTVEGRQHSIFANITQFFPSESQPAAVDGLPSLAGCVKVAGARPGATVLAVHPTQQSTRGLMPVLAVQPVGEGRAAVFTGDTTRNWHQAMRTLGRETPFLRFWGQTVRWLAGRSGEIETEAGIVATTDKTYYQPESTITISAVVRGPNGASTDHANVAATLIPPSGIPRSIPLAAVAGPAGNYRAEFRPLASGRYGISVQATLDKDIWKAETLEVDVGRPHLEFDRLDLDEQMLLAIADESGGSYAHISTADRLIERLLRKNESRLVQYELPLDWPPMLWSVFVLALTAEWMLRRRNQLR